MKFRNRTKKNKETVQVWCKISQNSAVLYGFDLRFLTKNRNRTMSQWEIIRIFIYVTD